MGAAEDHEIPSRVANWVFWLRSTASLASWFDEVKKNNVVGRDLKISVLRVSQLLGLYHESISSNLIAVDISSRTVSLLLELMTIQHKTDYCH